MHLCLHEQMTEDLEPAAELFKVLSSSSRLRLLRALAEETSTVGRLAEVTGLSQPLVSQHLRMLRTAGLVAVERVGREAHYPSPTPTSRTSSTTPSGTPWRGDLRPCRER